MMHKLGCLVWCLGVFVSGCSSSSNSNAGAAPAGALPCNGLAIDCRAAFADNYTGTYEGGKSGAFGLTVDILGGIQGSAPGSITITGQVNEFGQIVFTFSDGSTFTGQFSADHHSFSGTWKGGSQSGTFHGQSTTYSTGGNDAGSNPTTTVTASTVMAASETACQHAVSCGDVQASGCPVAMGQTQPTSPQECWPQELALYQCVANGTCAYQTECASAYTALDNCTFGTPDPGTTFNPPNTGSATFDDIVHLCAACATEAQACYEAQACKDYSLCMDGCTTGDTACTHGCTLLYSDGFVLYANAYTCRTNDC